MGVNQLLELIKASFPRGKRGNISNIFTAIMSFCMGLGMLAVFNESIQFLLGLFSGTLLVVTVICYVALVLVMMFYMPLHFLTSKDSIMG